MSTAQPRNGGTRVVVIGASGYIGTNLVPRLVREGYRVRAAARSLEVLAARRWRGVELARVDVLAPESLRKALERADIVYYLVHAMRAGDDFADVEQRGARNVAIAAAEADVGRIVYLGGLFPPGADSKHLVSRRVVGEQLSAGPVPVTELRAGIIVGPGCASFEIIRDLVNNLPVMVTPRWVRSKSPPVALHNVLEYLVAVGELPEAAGRVFDVAGPERLSYEQLMRQYGEHVGRRPMIIPVPVLSPGLSSYWLRLVTAVPTSTGRALIEGLKLDIHADDAELRRLVPQRLLTYRESVAAVFEIERDNAVAARWTEGALMYRDYNPHYAFYAKQASGFAVAQAPAAAVWAQIAAIGGDSRYYFGNGLWTLRELADWALGGPGLARGRRHPTELRVGDAIDSWRVIGVDEPRRLTLAFGMRAPGAGVMELEAEPIGPGHTRVTVSAYWHPAGVWGLIYWYAFAPSHSILFNGMARAIAERARDATRGLRTSPGDRAPSRGPGPSP